MTHGKTYNKSPRRINHKATRSKTNIGTTGGFKALLQITNFTLGPDATLNTETHKNSVRIKAPNSVNASKRKHKNQNNHYNIIQVKKVREKSRECHNHKPQPFPDPKRKRKLTNLNKHKPNKRTKNTKISSLFPKRGNRNTKRTEKHKNKMTHGKTYNKSPRRHYKTRLYNNFEYSTTKKWKFSDKKFWYLSYFCTKHRLWVLVRTDDEAVLTSTHNPCFEQK